MVVAALFYCSTKNRFLLLFKDASVVYVLQAEKRPYFTLFPPRSVEQPDFMLFLHIISARNLV